MEVIYCESSYNRLILGPGFNGTEEKLNSQEDKWPLLLLNLINTATQLKNETLNNRTLQQDKSKLEPVNLL